MYLLSRGATPVQQAVVSVDATEHAYTPSAAANASAPLLESGGVPADSAVPILIITKDDVANVSRDVGGGRNVSAEVGVVSADKNGCPPCDRLFGMLRTSSHHRRVQDVHMQVGLEDLLTSLTITTGDSAQGVVGSRGRFSCVVLGTVR